MKSKLARILIVAPILALSSMAFASEPVQLSVSEMDGVTAGNFVLPGAYANAQASASAIGFVAAATTTFTSAETAIVAPFYIVSSACAEASSGSL